LIFAEDISVVKRAFRRQRRKWDDMIKMDIRRRGRENGKCLELADDRD
jgi:predicted HAD superfamily phosphohydrolase